jgi:YfiH family protein
VSAIEFGEFADAARLVSWAASGRAGGASVGAFESLNLAEYVGDEAWAVAENRRRAASLVGLGAEDLAVMGAVHAAEVALVAEGGSVDGVDALVTTSRGVALLALAADCVPLVIADSRAGVIAAVHCGWRGLGAGVVSATVSVMRGLGAMTLEAVVGPAICAACYPVPADRVESLRRSLDGEVSDLACIERGGRSFIDVRAGVTAQLAALGIDPSHVPICTYESPDLFSYRRDTVTGRQGMIIRQ